MNRRFSTKWTFNNNREQPGVAERHRRSPLMTIEEVADRVRLPHTAVRGSFNKKQFAGRTPPRASRRTDGKLMYRLTEVIDYLRLVGVMPPPKPKEKPTVERILAYAFEADLHCPGCTKEQAERMKLDHNHPHAMGQSCKDDHGVEYDLVDCEGNLIKPVFVTDEMNPTSACGDCRAPLK